MIPHTHPPIYVGKSGLFARLIKYKIYVNASTCVSFYKSLLLDILLILLTNVKCYNPL
jgi:hypothetical protein